MTDPIVRHVEDRQHHRGGALHHCSLLLIGTDGRGKALDGWGLEDPSQRQIEPQEIADRATARVASNECAPRSARSRRLRKWGRNAEHVLEHECDYPLEVSRGWNGRSARNLFSNRRPLEGGMSTFPAEVSGTSSMTMKLEGSI